jgi:hypothetical protein
MTSKAKLIPALHEEAPEGFPFVVRDDRTGVPLAVFKERRDADLFIDSWNGGRAAFQSLASVEVSKIY